MCKNSSPDLKYLVTIWSMHFNAWKFNQKQENGVKACIYLFIYLIQFLFRPPFKWVLGGSQYQNIKSTVKKRQNFLILELRRRSIQLKSLLPLEAF